MANEIIHSLNTTKYAYNEQDCMNTLCKGAIFDLPPEYNACIVTKPERAPLITHYAGQFNIKFKLRVDNKQYRTLSWDEILNHRKEVQA